MPTDEVAVALYRMVVDCFRVSLVALLTSARHENPVARPIRLPAKTG